MHRITTIDVHVAGEPLRVISSGFPDPAGHTILEKRRTCLEKFDHFRRALMWEPRGHSDMYGCFLVSPSHPEADTGVLFFHNEGYSTMCGHGIIGLTTVMVEHDLFPVSEPLTTIRFDTPSGLVTAKAFIERRKVQSVSFLNVPSFVVALDQTIHVPGIGSIQYDLAFGGAFYAFCQADAIGIELNPKEAGRLKSLGMAFKKAIAVERTIAHQTDDELGFLYGTIFVGSPQTPEGDFRQVCIFADGALDRSPTGTGVSAHFALLYKRGKIPTGKKLHFESILGTQFAGTVVKETTVGDQQAIIPEVEGQAHITGHHEFVISLDDPLKEGYLLG